MHTYTPIIGAFNTIFGDPYLSVGLFLMLSFAFTAMGTWYLAKQFELPSIWAWILAFLFAFSPYKTSHLLEHHHLILTGHVPFFVLAFIRLYEETGFRNKFRFIILCVLLLGISVLSDYYTTLFLLIFSCLYAIFSYSKPYKIKWKYVLISFTAMVAIVHIMVSQLRVNGVDDKGGFYNSPDLSALLIPPHNSAIYGSTLFDHFEHISGFKGQTEQIVFLGWTLLLLLGYRIFKSRNIQTENLWVWFMVLAFFLLTFPKMKWAEHPLLYGPLSWIHQIPFFNNFRNPGRYFSMVYLLLPLALMLDFRHKFPHSKWITGLFICLLIEYIPTRMPTFSSAEVPSVIKELGTDEYIRNIVFVPDGVRDGFEEVGRFQPKHLLWSVHHRKNTPGAYISRVPAKKFEFYRSQKVLMWLSDSSYVSDVPATSEVSQFIEKFKPDLIVYDPKAKHIPGLQEISQVFKGYIKKTETREGLILFYF